MSVAFEEECIVAGFGEVLIFEVLEIIWLLLPAVVVKSSDVFESITVTESEVIISVLSSATVVAPFSVLSVGIFVVMSKVFVLEPVCASPFVVILELSGISGFVVISTILEGVVVSNGVSGFVTLLVFAFVGLLFIVSDKAVVLVETLP
uniref:Uncharacterized protein n=1 Tax=Panagrolaimus sp. PS1159 TaxID=55785 RepID=A0AC35F0Q4_9BILA